MALFIATSDYLEKENIFDKAKNKIWAIFLNC